MKDNVIDKAFRDKIRELERAPSEDAWTRIDSGIQGRRKAVWIVLKAAVIALVCIASAYLVLHSTGDKKNSHPPAAKMKEQLTIVEDQESVPEKATKPGQVVAPAQSTPTEKRELAVRENNDPGINGAEQISGQTSTGTVVADDRQKTVSRKQEEITEPEQPRQLASLAPSVVEPPAKKATGNENLPAEEKMSITIIYKSGSKTPQTMAANTTHTPPKESSALDKIVDKAREIRTYDLSLAELRAAKDDLLAINFRSDE